MPKSKAELMEETRQRRIDAGLVRKEVWIHKTRTREELDKAVKILQKPAKKS